MGLMNQINFYIKFSYKKLHIVHVMVKFIGCIFLIQNQDTFESCQKFDENIHQSQNFPKKVSKFDTINDQKSRK